MFVDESHDVRESRLPGGLVICRTHSLVGGPQFLQEASSAPNAVVLDDGDRFLNEIAHQVELRFVEHTHFPHAIK